MGITRDMKAAKSKEREDKKSFIWLMHPFTSCKSSATARLLANSPLHTECHLICLCSQKGISVIITTERLAHHLYQVAE